MRTSRSLWDRLIQQAKPHLVRNFAPPPAQIASGVWSMERRLRLPGGLGLPTRTTILRLHSDTLLVISPPPVAAGGLEALATLGIVAEVVVPNSFHYLYTATFLARYPQAVLRVVPGLHARVPGLPLGQELTEVVPSSWQGVVEHVILGPVRGVSEVALFHRPSATLILTDVAFNMRHFETRFERLAWRLNGVPSEFGHSRTARIFLLSDRVRTAAFLERVLAWPFTRVLVAHGEPLEANAVEVFRHAFARYLTTPPTPK